MQNNKKGFTLIELMMVVAIVAILVAVAIPTYQNYIIRANVTEGISLVEPAKIAVADTFQENSSVPNQTSTGYISPGPNATSNVNNITIASDGSGSITISYTANAGSGTIVFQPNLVVGSPITWNCTGGSLTSAYRPEQCR